MKNIKKAFALILALVMVLGLGATAFADEPATTGTITVENATYGKTYTAYKIFDATYSATDSSKISYTVPAAKKDLVDADLFDVGTVADGNGNYAVSAKSTAAESDIIDWVKANYASFDATGVTGTFNAKNDTVTFADIPFGYYYITSTLGTAITIDTNNPNATIKDKNASAPTDPVKKIEKVDGVALDDLAEAADAHVGSVIGFKVTGNATNWTTSGTGANVTSTQNTAYAFTDTYTNMTIDTATNFVVKVNGTAIAATAYTATASNGTLTVNIPLVDADGKVLYPAQQDNSAYIPIEITYEGTITAAAADEPATNEIGDEIVKIYTYAFKVAKTDGTDPLPGAQFELHSAKGVANGTAAALTFIDNGDATYTYAETAPEGKTLVTTLDMTTNTTIVVKGLDNKWTYTLKETKVPNGYNQAADKEIAGSSLTKVDENTTVLPTSSLYTETVVNRAGAELPGTGGIGTTIFYVIGGILLLGAGVVLVARRRVED